MPPISWLADEFATGLGAVGGPLIAAGAMGVFGPNGLFWTVAGVHALVVGYAAVRIRVGEGVPVGKQVRHALASTRAGPIAVQLALRTRRRPDSKGRPDQETT
jgi:hypothetical protein